MTGSLSDKLEFVEHLLSSFQDSGIGKLSCVNIQVNVGGQWRSSPVSPKTAGCPINLMVVVFKYKAPLISPRRWQLYLPYNYHGQTLFPFHTFFGRNASWEVLVCLCPILIFCAKGFQESHYLKHVWQCKVS